VHGVQSAKAFLIPAATILMLLAFLAVPLLRQSPVLCAWTLGFAVLRGLNPLWFFQGVERVKAAVAVETTARTAAAVGVFFVVRAPADAWRVVALQTVFAGVSLVVLTVWLHRRVPLRVPRFAAAVRTLREVWRIAACRGSAGIYVQANALILSALASPASVAFFGGAERIIRAAISLMQPLTQAFLPRVSYLQVADPLAARRMVTRTLLGMGLLGMAMGTTAFVGAPLLVRILLGPGYDAAIPVLRALAALPPLIAVNTVFGIYWALPFGHDRAYFTAILSAGAANVALAPLLVARFGAVGMAMSAVTAEVVVLARLGPLYWRHAS
jgi:polysaccharide transporter, PST family